MKNLAKLFLGILVVAIIAGCGFAPSGRKPLPPQLKQIYYESKDPYGQFDLNFKRKLKARGITLLAAPSKNSPVIQVAAHYSYTSNDPLSSIQGRIYNLNYTNTITISNYKNEPLFPAATVTVARTLTLGPNEVFENTPEIEISKNEMVHELIVKTFNILISPKTTATLQKLY